MKSRPFMDKNVQPAGEDISMALESTSVLYKRIMDQATGFRTSWTYSAASGWLQKVADSKKALFYVIIEHGYFTLSLTVRPGERILFLDDAGLKDIAVQLRDARKVAEGYHMLLNVRDKKQAEQVSSFIEKLIALRKK